MSSVIPKAVYFALESGQEMRKDHVFWPPIGAKVDPDLLYSWFDEEGIANEGQILNRVLAAIGEPFRTTELCVAGDGVGFEVADQRDRSTIAWIDEDGTIHPNPEMGGAA